jgi:nucleolar GTP-binding protein
MSANSVYNFKRIQIVPSGKDFVDIVLSKTQRKTPTVVHKGYPLPRIRQFYMRKVRFTQQTIHDKLSQILEDFPQIEDIHPFYADLMNVLYDRDHYKLALGQLSGARHLIDGVGKDYEKLLKFGDSLYRCKQLKRAALGRMATILKRHTSSLAYLEQVRQHLVRLPSIDPTTRTLLICGYPNVGKSSFLNKLTRANVEVQPYAFTTKSLFVGHMDYKYMRWQVIDTPGVLDRPLEDRNTIEMQSITALAHLCACILYFVDFSEQCGYTVKDQINLYHSIKPLFVHKQVLLVVNKIDLRSYDQLNPEEQALVQTVLEDGVELVQASCMTEEGVMHVKKIACDKLLNLRIETKMKGKKILDVLNRLHVAMPVPRDEKERPAFIPETAKNHEKAGVKDQHLLQNDDLEDVDDHSKRLQQLQLDSIRANLLKRHSSQALWKSDMTIPEIMDGKNVADFVDPEIEAKLDALEQEERILEVQHVYQSNEDDITMEDSDYEELMKLSKAIRDKKTLILQEHRLKSKNRFSSIMKRVSAEKIPSTAVGKSDKLSVDHNITTNRSLKRKRSPTRSSDTAKKVVLGAAHSAGTRTKRPHIEMGLKNAHQSLTVSRMAHRVRVKAGLNARRGESDRKILNMKPKHLFTGKRGIGSTNRR